jgi:hypothetical protein
LFWQLSSATRVQRHFGVIIDSLPQPPTTYRNRLDRLAGSGPGNVRFGSKADIAEHVGLNYQFH